MNISRSGVVAILVLCIWSIYLTHGYNELYTIDMSENQGLNQPSIKIQQGVKFMVKMHFTEDLLCRLKAAPIGHGVEIIPGEVRYDNPGRGGSPGVCTFNVTATKPGLIELRSEGHTKWAGSTDVPTYRPLVVVPPTEQQEVYLIGSPEHHRFYESKIMKQEVKNILTLEYHSTAKLGKLRILLKAFPLGTWTIVEQPLNDLAHNKEKPTKHLVVSGLTKNFDYNTGDGSILTDYVDISFPTTGKYTFLLLCTFERDSKKLEFDSVGVHIIDLLYTIDVSE